MKQKIVIKVSMSGQKHRSKAMKIAVGIDGVESAALKGADKTQIEVVGDSVDAVCLTTLLRKNIGFAELVSVAEVKKVDEPKKETHEPAVAHYTAWAHSGGVPVFHVQEYGYSTPCPCSIM